MRAIWKLLLAYALYIVWAYAATILLSVGFGALFEVWNLNADTLARAPLWARALAANYGRVVSLVSGAGVLLLSHALLRHMTGRRAERLRGRDVGLGVFVGAAAVALGAALFLWADSMRLFARAASPSWDIACMAAIYALVALSEERFARTLVMGVAGLRARPLWGYAASAIVFVTMQGDWTLEGWGLPNMLLMGLLCAHWSARGHAGLSVGFRFAWSFAADMLLAFPGGSNGARPLLSLYAVSEDWLTGGDRGLICGAWMTIALLLLAVPPLWPQLRRIRKTTEKKPR